jgi:hypothetical protein
MVRLALAVFLAAFASFIAPLSVGAAPPLAPTATQLPIVGAVTGGGTFTGTFTLARFANQAGQLVAVGTVTGMLTDASGQATSLLQTAALPVAAATATCDILHLDLGPLNLNLLGLRVDLSRIVLDITAEAGAGNLLGNLLCSVANLLNSPTGLARLLNQVLAAL